MTIEKKTLLIIALLLTFLVAAAASQAASFSVSVPAATEVTMRDPEAVIPVTVTHDGPNKAIRSLTFTVDTADYTFSTSTVAPDGWCVDSVSDGSITFALLQGSGACSNGPTANELSTGDSATFNLRATPAAAASDVTGDTLSSVTVNTQGGFTLSGSLPTWTRRSLEASITATPGSTGTGSEITVVMETANRSTSSHTTVSSTPDPPTPSSPLVTLSDGPYYSTTLLSGPHASTGSVIDVDSTSEFPSTGAIQVDSEEVCYTSKTATSFTGITRGCNGTTAADHSNKSIVYGLDTFTLAPEESGTITWVYRADLSGSLDFSARATGSGGSALSVEAVSNTVVIGDFTATASVTPTAVISGQTVTAVMNVFNNGSQALVDITPTLSPCPGGATETPASGPAPAFIPTLSSGGIGTFEWTYTVTGSVGEAYCLTGFATADGPVTTNTATSNTGLVSSYSVTVTPSTTASGSTSLTLAWSVHNGGGSDVNTVSIDPPTSGGDWNCSSVAPPSGWNGSCADPVVFESSNRKNDLPPGGTETYSITFSTTETVTTDKAVVFPVTISVRGGGGFSTTLGTTVTVTLYGLSLSHSPSGPIDADGTRRYTMTAVLTTGGAPVSGKTVQFTASGGSLVDSTAVTDSSGEAAAELKAPVSTTDTSSTVTAAYLDTTARDTVLFTGWTGPNLQYWGSLAPGQVDCGNSYTFTLDVTNVSDTTSMTLDTSSYFAFNDSDAGGSAVFIAYLDSPATVPPGSTATLSFGSPASVGGGGGVAVPTSFIAGDHLPDAEFSPPPEGGLFLSDGGVNDQRRDVTDTVTVGGSCGDVEVDVIDWRELP